MDSRIEIRINSEKKNKWILICKKKNISLTELIISAVENKIDNSERREVLSFIDKQGNIFSKIENNINQIARIVNTEKNINNNLLEIFNESLKTIINLKSEQNLTFKKIYKELAK